MASNFENNRENFKRELCLKIIIPFFISLLSVVLLRDAPKPILGKPKGEAQAVVGGGTSPLGPTVATALALATSTKNDTSVAHFVNSRKNNKPYFKPGLPIRT